MSAPVVPGRLRVLVVDDEPLIADAVRFALAAAHEVVVARSAREAVRLVGAQAPFDAVLCDLQLPDGTGMDVYDACCARAPGAERRIAFMTGGAVDDVLLDRVEAAGCEMLIKPFELDALPPLVAELAQLL